MLMRSGILWGNGGRKRRFLYEAMLKGVIRGFSHGEKLSFLVLGVGERWNLVGGNAYERLEKNMSG